MTLQEYTDRAKNIVFFGGAGVSTESGVPDFRSRDGLYSQKYDYPPETILSHGFFFSHTREFYKFYREKMLPVGIRPNAAHLKLAELERAGKLTAVVTQNIDGLHGAAGSKRVFELHGSTERNFCLECGKSYSADDIRNCEGIPTCSCGGLIKPDVVLYGEALNETVVEGAIDSISRADLLIVGGTSLTVYPAAGFLRYFKGDALILINRDPTFADSEASLIIREPIGRVMESIRV